MATRTLSCRLRVGRDVAAATPNRRDWPSQRAPIGLIQPGSRPDRALDPTCARLAPPALAGRTASPLPRGQLIGYTALETTDRAPARESRSGGRETGRIGVRRDAELMRFV
jgi:hypothetical protein